MGRDTGPAPEIIIMSEDIRQGTSKAYQYARGNMRYSPPDSVLMTGSTLD